VTKAKRLTRAVKPRATGRKVKTVAHVWKVKTIRTEDPVLRVAKVKTEPPRAVDVCVVSVSGQVA
jgi:hypothetical protein